MDSSDSDWQIDEFGPSHTGRAVAVLADGGEPRPMVYDTGGASGHTTSQWWVYDGTGRAPLATHLRAGCSCGWRGSALHPLDWAELGDEPYAVDPVGPRQDWCDHIDQVEARTVPLPDDLTDLLRRLDERLTDLAADAPVAALRAVGELERIAERVGVDAAHNVAVDGVPWETLATALGLTENDARARVSRYRYAH
ncbi:hypothetical protein [Streptacidiphilus sp. P02-A3a]|uniref:hypothetical protein n=1 Tax=Streptacidiphilus sp. P02-A3a TaxID=2704468 RepID=UPI0015FC8FAF|nr:hypothetical protein [Streptacidiphilus sp. P02-A3a]QMU71608.1 hypothetical protein GXP74_28585 [Streptacidiphilus sp. P02-A3a]